VLVKVFVKPCGFSDDLNLGSQLMDDIAYHETTAER
jgi:hypothetical protein